jgi:hypothetical protein
VLVAQAGHGPLASAGLLGVDWRPITSTEGKAMTAFVLVLAGVTAGDGGTRMGARLSAAQCDWTATASQSRRAKLS